MRNMVILYKDDDNMFFCRQLSPEGIDAVKASAFSRGENYWEDGGTILLDELEEILDKEI